MLLTDCDSTCHLVTMNCWVLDKATETHGIAVWWLWFWIVRL